MFQRQTTCATNSPLRLLWLDVTHALFLHHLWLKIIQESGQHSQVIFIVVDLSWWCCIHMAGKSGPSLTFFFFFFIICDPYLYFFLNSMNQTQDTVKYVKSETYLMFCNVTWVWTVRARFIRLWRHKNATHPNSAEEGGRIWKRLSAPRMSKLDLYVVYNN